MKKKEQANKKRMTLNQKRMLMGYVFILPWFIGFLYFYAYSIFRTFQFSFSDLTMSATGPYQLEKVGWVNYIHAFRVHGNFNEILTTSIFDILLDVPLIIFFSLFIAMLLNKKFPGRAVIRVIFFLPVIMASEAIVDALTMSMMMMSGGISPVAPEMASSAAGATVNVSFFLGVFRNLGLSRYLLDYLVEAVARINMIVSASGVQIIIFLAALQAIPASLYEVADIEGATGYETFWKVTFPLVMPHIITNVVYTIVDSFTKSNVVTLAYETAFSNFQFGLSSVFSIVSTIVTLAILFVICWLIQRRTFYYN